MKHLKFNIYIRVVLSVLIALSVPLTDLFWPKATWLDFLAIAIVILIWLTFLIYINRTLFIPINHLKNEAATDPIADTISQAFFSDTEIATEQMIKNVREYMYSEMASLNVEMLRKKSEYTALQNQINPHFLYNTLETIRSQAITDNNLEIADMVERLSSFFRYSISRKGEVVTLRDELNNIRNYMKILEFRFYDRYSLDIAIDEEDMKVYDYYVPRLFLQPIVENAINHGLNEMPSDGEVTIDVAVADDLIVTVSDNGKGMSLSDLDQLNEKIHSEDFLGAEEDTDESRQYFANKKKKDSSGTGIALVNVNKRIQLLYGKQYGITVYSTQNCGTDVEIVMPIVDKMESAAGE